MGQRRISWFEQNVEKVVMGIVGVALVGVVALQAIHQPNKVKVGPGPALPPEKAYDPVEKSAQELKGQTSNTNPPETPKITTNLTDKLDQKLKGGVVPSTKMAGLGAPPKIKQAPVTGAVGKEQIAQLKINAPTNVIGAAHPATIHPLERVWHSDLAALLPAQQPFDKVGVSVEATFDGTALAAALAADPDGDGAIQPIPLGLWQDAMTKAISVEIVQVELERELVRPAPGSKEAVGTRITVGSMPGRPDMRKAWTESVRSRGDFDGALGQIRAMSEQIQRPPYYALIAGLAWEEPKEMRDRWNAGNDPALINKLKAELTTARDQLKVAEDELLRLPVPGVQPKERDKPTPPAPRPGIGKGSGGTGPAPRPTQPKDQDPATLRLNAQNKVNLLKGKVTTLERRLSKLGVDIAQPAQTDQPQATAPAITLHENDEVKLWAHDMTATPGAAYRYRMRVVVNNPLFGANLVESQKSMGANSLLPGEFSEWSDVVEVDDLSDFFIISASESNPPASIQPSSNAQLFVYYYGKWRAANVGVNPGDVFAGEITVPEYPIYDLPELEQKFPADKGLPTRPGGQGAAPAPGGGRRPDRGPAPTNPSPSPAPGATPDAEKGLEGLALIEGVSFKPGPRTLAAGVASLFLDSQRLAMPGTDLNNRQREIVAAILRDPNGRVVARNPEDDKSSSSYRRIIAYQKAQEAQKTPPNAPKPAVNPLPNPGDGRRPVGPPSGGGGGG
jgi:hypothetical protein